MCGICCILGSADNAIIKDKERLVSDSRIGNRGPDASNWESVCLSPNAVGVFCGYVLHLRGELTSQPLTDIDGNVLLWNGEVFGGLPALQKDDNDTQVLLEELSSCHDDEQLVSLFSSLQGPWAFIYWQAASQKLWFGRDVFGRRSLLWHLPDSTDDAFILSSVRIGVQEFTEIPSLGIFSLKYDSEATTHRSDQLTLYPWLNPVWPATGEYMDKDLESKTAVVISHCPYISLHISSFTPHTFLPSVCKDLPPLDYCLPQTETTNVNYLSSVWESNSKLRQEAKKLTEVLGESVFKRVFNQNKRHLFGDSCLDRCSRQVNTCHANINNSDGDSTSNSFEMGNTQETETSIKKLNIHPTVTPENVVLNGSDTVRDIIHGKASVAILFSGGLDATVIAALADRYIPPEEPIDLLNVAFANISSETKSSETKKKKKQPKGSGQQPTDTKPSPFSVPDRLTGYAALQELNPNRRWNFIEVNITMEELQQARTHHVVDLLYPLRTVLDDSIGCAVWFAARGQGILGNGLQKGRLYCSHAKVVLCGMGADELFAGYSRHRSCFNKSGWHGLIDELQVEINRISSRNLGRDDRIISDHGREARFPYLDENVTSFIAQLPVHIKTDLTLGRGLGEKLLLRLCALHLDLPITAIQPKRAIQFGSRIAKLENSKEKADDVCIRLK